MKYYGKILTKSPCKYCKENTYQSVYDRPVCAECRTLLLEIISMLNRDLKKEKITEILHQMLEDAQVIQVERRLEK